VDRSSDASDEFDSDDVEDSGSDDDAGGDDLSDLGAHDDELGRGDELGHELGDGDGDGSSEAAIQEEKDNAEIATPAIVTSLPFEHLSHDDNQADTLFRELAYAPTLEPTLPEVSPALLGPPPLSPFLRPS